MFKTPISVLVLIHTADLKVLLIERADKPGLWQSVTGSVEVGDSSIIDTAIREVMEETGIDATRHKLTDWKTSNTYEIYTYWRYRYAPGVTENIEHQFGLELTEPVAVSLAPDEHVNYVWVDWREAAKRVFSWTNVDALRKLGDQHGLTL